MHDHVGGVQRGILTQDPARNHTIAKTSGANVNSRINQDHRENHQLVSQGCVNRANSEQRTANSEQQIRRWYRRHMEFPWRYSRI
jgi:hypothetical protein